MADNDGVPQTEGDEPPAGDASPAATGDAAPKQAALSSEELAQLRREAAQAKASQTRADKLEQELKGYRDSRRQQELDAAGEDGKLQVELEQERKLRQAAEQKATMAERRAAYPHAAKVLEDDIATLSEERVAALNASLAAEADEAEAPTPRGTQAARRDSVPVGGEPKPKTSEELIAELSAMPVPATWGGREA